LDARSPSGNGIEEVRVRILEFTLMGLGWIGMVVIPVCILVTVPGRNRFLAIGTAVTLLSWGLWAAVKRGWRRSAGWTFVLVLIALFTAAAWTAGGLLAPVASGYLMLILLAGLVLGVWEGAFTAFLVVLCGLGMGLAQQRGMLPEPWVSHTPLSRWVSLACYSLAVAWLQGMATRYIRAALERASEELRRRREVEASLKEALEELETRVTARTADLAMALGELAQRAEELEAARKAQSRFLAFVSHEFRSPLTSIHGAVRLLQAKADLPLEAGPLMDMANRNTLRMLALADELLDVEKAQAGQFSVVKVRMDLAACLKAAAHRMEGWASERGRGLEVRILANPPLIAGDPARLEQVCLNLLSNAFKHAQGEGDIHLDLLPGPRVRVSNPGPPLSASVQAGLFKPFYQERPDPGSTGLGLVIAKAIVEAHGGAIGFECLEGRVFFFFDVAQN
jgi:signal transduction histidine kinase